ncbi:hypothetical protein ACS0TY_014110 [Phlomoides rotata]
MGCRNAICMARPKRKANRTLRPWTDGEETILLDKLLELVRNGWKTDNGFKPGYQLKLEHIRASPHINSKIIMWKRSYVSIRTMLTNSSSVGFNTTTHLSDCTVDQWARVVKKDPIATNIRYKTWSMYNSWIEVFENDRATGYTGEDVYEAFKILSDDENEGDEVADECGESQNGHHDPEINMETNEIGYMDADSQIPDLETPSVDRSSLKMRHSSSLNTNDAMVNVMDKFVTSSYYRLGSLCRALGYEANLGKARQDIFTILECIPELTLDKKIDVSKILVNNPHYLEMFLSFMVEAQMLGS